MNTLGIAKKVIAGFFDWRVRRSLIKKVNSLLSHHSGASWQDPPETIVAGYRKLWKKTGIKADTRWLKVYGNISGEWDYRYIPETIYYSFVEPSLNNKSFSKCFTDKNLSSLFLKGFKCPEIIVSNIEEVFYGANLAVADMAEVRRAIMEEKQIIIKPSTDSGGGKDVTRWRVIGENLVSNDVGSLTIEGLLVRYKKNFIIQRVIDQHPFYSRYNASSVNTVRMLTYRSPVDEKIHVIHSVFRVGASGKVTDNQASGGFACGVTKEGTLTGLAVDKKGNSYVEVNNVPLEKGLRLEKFDEISSTAIGAAGNFYYSRLLGFDLCVDKEGAVVIIEVNNINNEINFFQMLSGPLFGEFTEEIAGWCSQKRRSFMIDFEI